ncbi:MAG: hypothetical protein WC515_03655 [Candidatus Omnitrophota bacterium]
MRYLWIAVIFAAFLGAGICVAGEAEDNKTVVLKEIDVDRDGDGAIDGKDAYDDTGRLVRRGYDENGDGTMDRWQSYDPNTGLPIVVPSDAAGELN